MTRKIFVTGATGYVGSALVPRLAQEYEIKAFDTQTFGNSIAGTPNTEFITGDIRDEDAVIESMRGCTDVIHLAGIVVDELVDLNPDFGYQVNVGGTNNIIKGAWINGVKRIIYMSSSSVYGSRDFSCGESTPPQPSTEYARQKLIGEEAILDCSRGTSIAATAIRSATLCGPAPRMRLDTIVNVFSKQAYYDGVITVFDGTQWRSNIHVDDMVDLYKLLLKSPEDAIKGKVFNASMHAYSALDIAKLVQDAATDFGLKGVQLRVDTGKRDGRHYRMDASYLNRALGWRPRRGIMDAAQDNFTYFSKGGIDNPDSDLYYNLRRMSGIVGAKG